MIVAPEQWLRDLRQLCDDYDILMIVDDIQVGCGRTGNFFSFERAGIVPDMITLSKSISGAGLPMSLLLMRPALDVFTPGEHNGTFRGNQLAFVAGKAAIEFMKETDLLAAVRRKEQIVRDFMTSEILPLDERLAVRGIGLIWGIEFGAIDPALSKKASQRCFENKLVIERAGRQDSVLKPLPALTIPEEDLMKGLETVREAVAFVLGK